MKLLVTGGAGFIGSNFVLKQVKAGNTVLNIDKLTYAGNTENLSEIANDSNYSFLKADIVDEQAMRAAIQDFQPDSIVHFAAESHVDRSIDGPLPFVETNVMGTAVLLSEAAAYYERLSGDKKPNFRFLHVSTDEVFGALGDEGKFNPDTPYDPSSPYSASKAGSDHLVRAWFRTFGLPTLITNCTNNYGPFQFPEKLIPHMILSAVAGKPLPIYGTGENVRDWLHVEDHCDAIYRVLESGNPGETYLIGGESEVQNIEVVQTICDILDDVRPLDDGKSYRDQMTFVTDRPGHDFRYAMDIDATKQALDWSPAYEFESGLRQTVEWYLSHEEWWQRILSGAYQVERIGVKS